MKIQLKDGLVGHWPGGVDYRQELADQPAWRFGAGDFTIALRVHTDGHSEDIVGDLVSKFDPKTRRGFNLGVVTLSGMTFTTAANNRNIQFGIDDGKLEEWKDCGRPGNAVHIVAMAVVQGKLYAGTLEMGADQQGHLWRYEGGQQWTDLGGTPDGSSAVESIAEFNGALYCGTGRYNPMGSRLGPQLNKKPGGRVYRIESDGRWIECGKPGSEDAVPDDKPVDADYETGKADEATCLTVYRGKLYCTSHHRRGAFEYEGGQRWRNVGPNERIMSFTVFRDRLYALVNGKNGVLRYEGGSEWTSCGVPPRSDQNYAAVAYDGKLLVGTWPECEVVRYDGDDRWTMINRVGFEREVMAMALYNAKVYVGTLPMANVWRMDGNDFTFVGNLDNSPVPLRRVWSMAVYQGKLFAGMLPSGHIKSLQAGRMATHDRALPTGEHHLAAVRAGDRLKLYQDGVLVSESAPFKASDYNLDNDQPLRIGCGVGHPFRGTMRDLRLYHRALSPDEIERLAHERTGR
ncbi:MAG: LamG domain-containing protein [Verrucomicrobiae bacterium]|nr:LamG domain-containing protein [Verrucomicrobiae bacterium]